MGMGGGGVVSQYGGLVMGTRRCRGEREMQNGVVKRDRRRVPASKTMHNPGRLVSVSP
jgi:hypothetical protein